MQFSFLYAAASLLAIVVAQTSNGPNAFKNPTNGYNINAGQSTTLNWTPTTSGTITLTLRDGASSDLNKGVVLASGLPNSGSATVTIPADTVRNSDYTIQISSDSDSSAVNYTPQFVVESSNTVESASASASASASSAATSAASASSAASVTSAASATSASASSASAASASSASASSGASSASAASASSTKSASESASKTTSGSATSTHSGSTSSMSAESAPTSGASSLNRFHVQGGLAVAALGAAVLL